MTTVVRALSPVIRPLCGGDMGRTRTTSSALPALYTTISPMTAFCCTGKTRVYRTMSTRAPSSSFHGTDYTRFGSAEPGKRFKVQGRLFHSDDMPTAEMFASNPGLSVTRYDTHFTPKTPMVLEIERTDGKPMEYPLPDGAECIIRKVHVVSKKTMRACHFKDFALRMGLVLAPIAVLSTVLDAAAPN